MDGLIFAFCVPIVFVVIPLIYIAGGRPHKALTEETVATMKALNKMANRKEANDQTETERVEDANVEMRRKYAEKQNLRQ